jgi:DNA-binding NtrC family response regulator
MSHETTDRHRILIADDSEVCCGLLALVLKNAAYDVVCVSDGVQAIEAMRAVDFDLVILDHDMPKLDGLGALSAIRSSLPRLPVLICSGVLKPGLIASYEKLGVGGLFTKPINPIRLREQVAQTVEHYRQLVAVDPQLRGASYSYVPFQTAGIDARVLEKPIFSGVSAAAKKLVDGFSRMRQFKVAATIEGRPGAGYLDFAMAMAESKDALLVACPAAKVSDKELIMLLAPALLLKRMVILIITNTELLTLEQQAVLEALFTGEGALDPFFAEKVRLILCAEASLHSLADSGAFDENLLLRAGAMTQRLPELSVRREDVFLIARAVLRRIGASGITITPAAQVWLETEAWPGDYLQLHRTIELAAGIAENSGEIDKAHLASASAKELVYRAPLFHDILLSALYNYDGMEGLA